jgi:TonB family protein
MSNPPQGAESPLEIVDRRLCARRPVPSLAYVDLGENNGGIILNIGEGGLAVTLVAPLATNVLARMRFQLPGSDDWLEARGEIARISESKKEAGLRFVDLCEEARGRIENWVSTESPGPSQRATAKVSVERRPANAPPTHTVKSATTEFARTDGVAHEEAQGLMPSADTDTRLRAEEQSDRRVHVRRPVPSLAYVDLGENNGGVIMNIGEGGLALTSVAPLYTDALAQMRFQLPGSSEWLEASGKMVRISASKKEAGLRFVDLSEDARNHIKGWISSNVSPAEFQPEEFGTREKAWRRLDMPIMGIPQSLPPRPVNSDRVTRERAQVLTSSPKATSTPVNARTWVAASAPTDLSSRSWGEIGHRPGVGAGAGPRRILLQWRTWAIVAVVLFLGSFFTGWFTAGPGSMSRMLNPLGKTRSETNETANGVGSPPANSAASVPVQSSNAPTEAHGNEIASSSGSANVGNSTSRVTHSQERVLRPSPVSATANVISAPTPNAPPQGVGNAAAQTPETGGTTPPSPNVNQPEGARTVGTAEPVISPAPKPAENPEVVKPSVSVSFGLYPSIRIPAGLKTQMPKQGASLKIGQLLSRVDPVYPGDAETQQIEGTVKLHALIGPDGAIESVEPRGGPALLTSAASDAVRQWRFTPSSIGGQPVEAEEDITIIFRLRK